MNAFERFIENISPTWAARRATDRYRLARITKALRGYEGAAVGRRTDNWNTNGRDANAEIAPSLPKLRARARDLRRNNAYASAAIESIIDNTVGYGIKPKPKGRNKTITKRAADAWKAHAETTAIDRDGKHDIYGLQALAMGTIAESGSVIVRRYLRDSNAGLPLPFQIQVLEPDYIDMNIRGANEDGSVDINGIRFEKDGSIRGYWLYDIHPGAVGYLMKSTASFVPARDVLHIFRMDRPGQIHGVPWAAPTLLRIRNFDEVEDAYIEREKIAACFAVFFSGQGEGDSPSKITLADKVEPGIMQWLPPGTDVKFSDPPGVNGYRDFSWVNLHAIAAGFGVPYEVFGDLAGVNFSSGRMGWQNYQRRIDRWQWQMFIPGFCGGVWDWFNSSCQFAGVLPEDCPAQWVPPRRMMVNPKEDIAAMKDAVRNGFETWDSQVASLGYDADEQIEQIKATNEKLDAADVKLDCDPRFALPAGSAAASNSTDSVANSNQNADNGINET